MLDSYGQREPERLEHLVGQVLYLLHGLRSYRCSDLIVLRAGWDVGYGDPLRNACGSLHDSIMVLRVDQHLRAGGVLEALGSLLPHRTCRNALDEFTRKGIVHHGSDESNTQHGSKLTKVSDRAGANAQARARRWSARRRTSLSQRHNSFRHNIGKYFCEGIFHEVTADVVTNGYHTSFEDWSDS